MVIGSVYVEDADDYDVDDKVFLFDPNSDHQDKFTVDYHNGNITMKKNTPPGQYLLKFKVNNDIVITCYIPGVDLHQKNCIEYD